MPTLPNARDNIPYYDGVDPDSSQFPEDNDHVMPNDAVIFEKLITDQWTHIGLNLPDGSYSRKRKLLVELKTEMMT